MMYVPKHMIYKEAILDRWQAQAANAAGLLGLQDLDTEGRQARAFLYTMSQSRELNEIMYDYAVDDDYKPKHLVALPPAPPAPGKSRSAKRCSCGNLVGPYGNGRCGPSGCINVPA